jgi:hypothetical protein
MLRIFIALKNSLFSARFEPTNLGSNGKYYNHYTAENTTTTYFANNLHNLDSNKVTPISVRHYYHEERKKLFCNTHNTTKTNTGKEEEKTMI